jgi:hypothetical protein
MPNKEALGEKYKRWDSVCDAMSSDEDEKQPSPGKKAQPHNYTLLTLPWDSSCGKHKLSFIDDSA